MPDLSQALSEDPDDPVEACARSVQQVYGFAQDARRAEVRLWGLAGISAAVSAYAFWRTDPLVIVIMIAQTVAFVCLARGCARRYRALMATASHLRQVQMDIAIPDED